MTSDSGLIGSLLEVILSKAFTGPVLVMLLYRLFSTKGGPSRKEPTTAQTRSPFEVNPVDSKFNWETAYPRKYRPFKDAEYQIQMGLANIEAQDWLMIESSYKQRIDKKLEYLNDPEKRPHLMTCSTEGEDALRECYDIITAFMLQRYPMCFKVQGYEILNLIRGETIPLNSSFVENPIDLTEHIARFIEEDVLILLRDEESGEYILRAGIMGFAAGFAPSQMFNSTLDQIHGPVPRYRTQLKKPMGRFFDKIKVGMFVNRFNWNAQPHNKLSYFGHGKNEEQDGRSAVLIADVLDFSREVFLRSERQCLTRLPKTGAVVFTVRTYTTPMSVIKSEGSGDRLVKALDQMPDDVAAYKGRDRVRNAVADYMSGKSKGADRPWIEGFR
jgi:hypothetical protein